MDTIKVLSFCLEHLEGLAGAAGLIFSGFVYMKTTKDRREDLEDKKKETEEKRIEIYMNLFQQWDELWTKITAFPDETHCLFQKDLNEIQDENMRLAICNGVNLLSRAFYYYQKTNQDITKGEWFPIVKHVFNKPVFTSAFLKHHGRYSQEFQDFVKPHLCKVTKRAQIEVVEKRQAN